MKEVDVTAEEERFYRDLEEFVNKKRIEYPNPVLMSRTVDLFKMYKSVQERGGYNIVTKENTWKFVFLDCTDAPSYSSNTGYYTRLSYEKSILGFDRSRPNPFPRVYKEDEEKMMKKKTSKYPSGNQVPSSPKSVVSEIDTDSEIDPQELETILQFDYDQLALEVENPPDEEEEREKWFEECEERLRQMQTQHRSLQKFLYRIDKKLGLRSQANGTDGEQNEGTEDEHQKQQQLETGDDTDQQQGDESGSAAMLNSTEDEPTDIEAPSTTEKKKRQAAIKAGDAYGETEDESDTDINMQPARKKRRRRHHY